MDVSVASVVKRATEYLLAVQRTDGEHNTKFWCGETVMDSTVTSQYVMFSQILGVPLESSRRSKIVRYFRECQNPVDGSWCIAYGHGIAGDVSTTTEAYLALTILGLDAGDEMLIKARQFIVKKGGPPCVHIFTKIHLALFGLLSWNDVPVMPAELILLPVVSPINIYSFAVWARATIVPLLVIAHHKRVYALPNVRCYEMMDALWPVPKDSRVLVPHMTSLKRAWEKHGWSWQTFFTAAWPALEIYDKIKLGFVRKYAISKCVKYISEHQDEEGDTAGITAPMLYGALAMTLEGYKVASEQVRGFWGAVERLSWEADGQLRIQICSSPVYDTSLSLLALLECGWDAADGRVEGAIQWLQDRQLLHSRGDWQVVRPNLEPGGWAFQYVNSWCPDTDDTATVVLCLLKYKPELMHSYNLRRGMKWTVGMQNKDGGWAAFDVGNDKLFLNDIPCLDVNASCDPSTPDLTGHILEMLGTYLKISEPFANFEPHESIRRSAKLAVEKAIQNMRNSQETEGPWFGRWGVTTSSAPAEVYVGWPLWISSTHLIL